MTLRTALISATARELEREFDSAFARPPLPEVAEFVNLLAIRVGSTPYAMRLSEIAGLHANMRIVALPNRSAELLGIAGLRGSLVPVYSLGKLLAEPVVGVPRWIVLTKGHSVALAFDELDAYLHIPMIAISRSTGVEESRSHAREVISVGDLRRPIVDVDSILESIKTPERSPGPQKE